MKFINATETMLNVNSNDLKLLFMHTVLWVLILSKCQFKLLIGIVSSVVLIYTAT